MINIAINGIQMQVEEGKTILETCLKHNIDVPYLCWHPDLAAQARCRICIVEANGKMITSCNTKVQEDMNIVTENEEIIKARKLNLELLIANHDIINENNEVAELAKKLGITESRFDKLHDKSVDSTSAAIYRDNNKCILCGRCVQKCQEIQSVYALGFANRGHYTEVTSWFDHGLGEVACTQCGQCSNICPSGAITEVGSIKEVMDAVKDPDKVVIVQTAPSIRGTLGETQGMPPGSLVTGKMVSALRRIGFDKVLDTDFTADLTIVEEGTELIHRIKNKGILPMITSCSPGWIKFIEHFFPELLPNLSTCKSPQQMFGTLAKTYYAEKNNMDPSKIISVSIMPCTAKKFECARPEMDDSGFRDVDYVLTTRETGKIISAEGIDFKNLPDESFDPIMGSSSGAAAIFGATGGVMEAALRTAADILEGKDLEKFEYTAVRGQEGIKEAAVEVAGMKINVAIAHGLENARRLMETVKENPSKYHFIEIMACVGGCVGGGGQPMPTNSEVIRKRSGALYNQDKNLELRKSHKNPEIIQLYKDFLGEAGGHKAHELLHTKYTKRNVFGD
ncbi:MAG: [FeFe] hydrogenase, group A [Nanoarchaeota archaeon]|nr:[FeFe] hydrogenase, group A [Nanoarchaeota archaeon]